jgi:hypothetical protein
VTALRKRPFAVSLPVATVEDDTLSWRARGVLAGILAKPDGWDVRADQIARAGKEGRGAILTALRELRDRGYLRTIRRQLVGDEAAAAGQRSGTWVTETEASHEPVAEWIAEAESARKARRVRTTGVGLPDVGQPNAGSPDVGYSAAIRSTYSPDQLPLRGVGQKDNSPPPSGGAADPPDQANRAEARLAGYGDMEAGAGALLDGLPVPWSRIGPQSRRRLLSGVARALADGWASVDLAAHLSAHPDGVQHPGRVLLARLADLPAPPAAVPADDPRDPWCGVCDEETRRIEDPEDDYRPLRCATCHPHRDRSVAS